MLESMAMGIPTVATAIAGKGVQATPGKDFLVADSPEDFASAVVELLDSPARASLVAQAARAHLEAAHNWSTCLQAMDGILEEAVSVTLAQ
jgi:glycosyltransferase involved in cell wall biosynthesis